MFLGKVSEIVGYIFSSTKTVELRRPTSSSGAFRFAGSFSVDIWYTFDVIDSIQYRKLLPNLLNTSWLRRIRRRIGTNPEAEKFVE